MWTIADAYSTETTDDPAEALRILRTWHPENWPPAWLDASCVVADAEAQDRVSRELAESQGHAADCPDISYEDATEARS